MRSGCLGDREERQTNTVETRCLYVHWMHDFVRSPQR